MTTFSIECSGCPWFVTATAGGSLRVTAAEVLTEWDRHKADSGHKVAMLPRAPFLVGNHVLDSARIPSQVDEVRANKLQAVRQAEFVTPRRTRIMERSTPAAGGVAPSAPTPSLNEIAKQASRLVEEISNG